jgi:hypothetical protein
MIKNAFPSVKMRRWTDEATIAEVEERAKREGSDVWALELVRKRCAVGDARRCATEEIGRAMLLAEAGRLYAQYVIAESHLRLAGSTDPAVSGAVALWSRSQAPEALFSAALRGDGKAEHFLTDLGGGLGRPWTAVELKKAAFSAISAQQVESAMAAASGRVPRQWAPRPTRDLTSTVQRVMDYEARSRSAHADSIRP